MDKLLAHLFPESLQAIQDIAGAWFMGLDLNSMDLVLIASLVVSWISLALALAAIKRIKKQSVATYHLYEKVARDLHVASSGAIGMGQRIIAVEKRMANQVVAGAGFQAPLHSVSKTTDTVAPDVTLLSQKSTELEPIKSKTKKADKVEPGQTEDDNPFDTAKKLLRRGVDQAEVARRCGLSPGETALMAMVLTKREGQASLVAV